MTGPTIEQAYAEACRQLGAMHVQAAMLRTELVQAHADLDEAGARIVELTQESDGPPEDHQGCGDAMGVGQSAVHDDIGVTMPTDGATPV